MFKKNKKNNSFLEDEIMVATSKTVKSDKKKKRREHKTIKTIKDIKIFKPLFKDTKEYKIGNFTYYNSDPQNECSVDDSDLDKTEYKEKSTEKKKDLSFFFEKSKRYNSMMKEKETKGKKNNKNKKNDNLELSNTNIISSYVFRNIRYTEVEDFINYLDSHYLVIEKISKEVLSDEKFYEWLSKKSKVFDDSVKEFKEIKEKIEKK